MCQTLKKIYKDNYRIYDDRGASVVETTIIVPMILMIIMGLLLFTFFLLDMSVIKSETVQIANEIASDYKKEEKYPISEGKKNLQKRIQGRLVLADLVNSNVTVSAGNVIAKADITYDLMGDGLKFSASGKVSIDNREKWVRLLAR